MLHVGLEMLARNAFRLHPTPRVISIQEDAPAHRLETVREMGVRVPDDPREEALLRAGSMQGWTDASTASHSNPAPLLDNSKHAVVAQLE